MNLMINNYCNLKCSYCFAQETMGSSKAVNITIENFCKYLDWLKFNNDKEVRLIGGEPTLHPHLDQLIDKVIEYNFFNRILIFSNMTFSSELTKMFINKSSKILISFLPNINELDLIIPSYKEKILYNLDVLSLTLDKFDTIGVNLYSPIMNLDLWEELICKYNIRNLRFSIVLPNTAVKDDFDFYNYFHSFQNLILQLVDIAKKYNVFLCNDCNSLPICCYDGDALTKMLKGAPELFDHTHCSLPAIDILPDLTVMTCFVTNVKGDKVLTDFITTCELDNYVLSLRKDKDNYIVREECRSCDRFIRTNASCSCLSYRKIKK